MKNSISIASKKCLEVNYANFTNIERFLSIKNQNEYDELKSELLFEVLSSFYLYHK